MSTTEQRADSAGWAYGLIAYGLWGVLPIYWRAVGHVDPLQLLAHRVVWTMPVFVGWVALRGRLPALRAAFSDGSARVRLVAAALLLATNWFVFVYAILTERVLDASLGYFINPLVSVALGRVVLAERLRPLQLVAVGLAAVGIGAMAVRMGGVPWISLALAASFGGYGLLRKTTSVQPIVGSAFETLVLVVPAVAFVVFCESTGTGAMLGGSPSTVALLLASGIVTAAPLYAFVNAAPRLPLSTLGFLQFVAPSLQFVLAVAAFGEPLQPERLLTFGFVWSGVAVFVLDAFRRGRGVPR
ncbi:MAG: EamA family transporter RarD [Nannocystaceae bacterium]